MAAALPQISQSDTLLWVTQNTETALIALKTLGINIQPSDPNYSVERVAETFFTHIANTNSPVFQDIHRLSSQRFGHIQSLIYFLRDTLASAQVSAQQHRIIQQNLLRNMANALLDTARELSKVRNEHHALAQRMPSNSFLGTATVGLFVVGALVSHVVTQLFSSPSDLLQNDCTECDEKLTQLHGEYQNMQALGQACLDQRKEVGQKLSTCADLLKKAVEKKQ